MLGRTSTCPLYLKKQIQPELKLELDKLKTLSSAMFTYRGNAGDFARWAQFFLAVIFSLVFIYAIRELKQGKQIRARDALYGGTGNLVPFMMNIGLIALQLIPFTMVSVIYNIGMSRQLFVNNLEKFSGLYQRLLFPCMLSPCLEFILLEPCKRSELWLVGEDWRFLKISWSSSSLLHLAI